MFYKKVLWQSILKCHVANFLWLIVCVWRCYHISDLFIIFVLLQQSGYNLSILCVDIISQGWWKTSLNLDSTLEDSKFIESWAIKHTKINKHQLDCILDENHPFILENLMLHCDLYFRPVLSICLSGLVIIYKVWWVIPDESLGKQI